MEVDITEFRVYAQMHRGHEVLRRPSYIHSVSRTRVDETAIESGTSSTVLDTGSPVTDKPAFPRHWHNEHGETDN